jgi:hypothetical protein
MVKLAEALGRELWNRGSEPNYVRKKDPELSPPLSIPRQPEGPADRDGMQHHRPLLSDCDDWEIYFLQRTDDRDC